MSKRKKSPKKRLLTVLGVSTFIAAGVAGGLYTLSNTYATSDRCTQIKEQYGNEWSSCSTLYFNNATKVETESAPDEYNGSGEKTIVKAFFSINNEEFPIVFDNGYGYDIEVDSTSSRKSYSQNTSYLEYYNDLFTYSGDFESKYYAYLKQGDNFYSDLSCWYDDSSNTSHCYPYNGSAYDGTTLYIVPNNSVTALKLNDNAGDIGSGDIGRIAAEDDYNLGLSNYKEIYYSNDGDKYLYFENNDDFKNYEFSGSSIDEGYHYKIEDLNDQNNPKWSTTLVYDPNRYRYYIPEDTVLPNSNKFRIFLTHEYQETISVSSADGSNSYYNAHVFINGTPYEYSEAEIICEREPNNAACTSTNARTIDVYEEPEDAYSDDRTKITFSTLFTNEITDITINGESVNVPFNYSNRAQWLAHYNHQLIEFDVYVDEADSYDIKYNVAENRDNVQISNFLWTNKDEDKGTDDYLGKAKLELVSMQCNMADNQANIPITNVNSEESHNACKFEYEYDEEEKVGTIVAPSDSVITVKIVPEYGYQVTGFGTNGQNVAVDKDKVSEFTFTATKGNYHLSATVEKVDNEVKADSESIESGSVELDSREISGGTAMLTVSDADLSEEEIAEFENEAGEDYTISSYLEIDLDQIFYDGHDGIWYGEELEELDHEATITLKLKEGVDGNKVVIIHKKQDGTYETIPTSYNAQNHTITFKTTSFSDYAIASTYAEEAKNSNTIDHIVKYVAIALASSLIAAFAIVKAKKVKASE